MKNGGLDEGLKHENPLIMASNSSGEALAMAVEKIGELEESEIDSGLRRQNMERHFSWDSTFSKLTALYLELVQKNTPSQSETETTKYESEDSALLT